MQRLDVVMCMKRMAEQKIESMLYGMEEILPHLDWFKARKAMVRVFR